MQVAVEEGVDFALVAYREENLWRVAEISVDSLDDIDVLSDELRRWPGDFGSIGLISVDEDFFVLVRVAGANTRVLLSDVTAATEWPLARSVVDALELPVPEDEDDQVPAGDLDILEDLGLPAMDMAAMLDDFELYPDELLGDIATKLGFGAEYDELLGAPTL